MDDLFEIVDEKTVVVRLNVHPGAGRTAVVGRHGDALKVKVAAAPERGRANDACVALVAGLLGRPEGDVELTGGAASRLKRLKVAGVEADEVRRRLELALQDAAAGPSGNSPGRRNVRPPGR